MADGEDRAEIWKPVVGFEGLYEVSDRGRVKSLGRAISYYRKDGTYFQRSYPAKIVSQGWRGGGYRVATLSRFRQPKAYQTHRLVCEAFHGPPPPKAHAAHLNGDRTDNRASNLVWASPKENHEHKRDHGTFWEGANHPRAKLSEEDVLTIRRRKEAGECSRAIAADYGVHKSTVQYIATRRSWRCL